MPKNKHLKHAETLVTGSYQTTAPAAIAAALVGIGELLEELVELSRPPEPECYGLPDNFMDMTGVVPYAPDNEEKP